MWHDSKVRAPAERQWGRAKKKKQQETGEEEARTNDPEVPLAVVQKPCWKISGEIKTTHWQENAGQKQIRFSVSSWSYWMQQQDLTQEACQWRKWQQSETFFSGCIDTTETVDWMNEQRDFRVMLQTSKVWCDEFSWLQMPIQRKDLGEGVTKCRGDSALRGGVQTIARLTHAQGWTHTNQEETVVSLMNLTWIPCSGESRVRAFWHKKSVRFRVNLRSYDECMGQLWWTQGGESTGSVVTQSGLVMRWNESRCMFLMTLHLLTNKLQGNVNYDSVKSSNGSQNLPKMKLEG